MIDLATSALSLLALPAATMRAPLATSTAYDPIPLAVDQLNANGYPPPEGYTIIEVPRGSLGKDIPARTDSEAKIIRVDTALLLGEAAKNGDPSPETVIAALTVILRHEYHHTPDYGTPSPGGGYSTDLCTHMEVARDDLDVLCERICAEPDPMVKAALCKFHDTWSDGYNKRLIHQNRQCPDASNRVFLCGCCD